MEVLILKICFCFNTLAITVTVGNACNSQKVCTSGASCILFQCKIINFDYFIDYKAQVGFVLVTVVTILMGLIAVGLFVLKWLKLLNFDFF